MVGSWVVGPGITAPNISCPVVARIEWSIGLCGSQAGWSSAWKPVDENTCIGRRGLALAQGRSGRYGCATAPLPSARVPKRGPG